MAWKKKSAVHRDYTEKTLYDYAVFMLGRKMRTVAELKRMMRGRAGHQPDGEQMVEAVTARLKEQHYLSDTNYATSYSNYRRETEKFGPRRVVQDLRAKGVHPELADRVVAETYSQVDEEKLAREFVARKRLKPPAQQKDSARIFRMMVRAGFSSRVICRILREWHVEDETLTVLEQERELIEAAPGEEAE